MRRYLMDTPIERKRLQLLGIGALCLACKHEEVMIPNMNDFIYICDNAYKLEELMQVEVEMLSSLDAQLHTPQPALLRTQCRRVPLETSCLLFGYFWVVFFKKSVKTAVPEDGRPPRALVLTKLVE